MHEQYSEKPEDFNHNPEGKLVALIQDHGGVSGLAETVISAIAEEAEPDVVPSPKQSRTSQLNPELVATEISGHALTQLKASEGIGGLTLNGPFRVGVDNLLLLLARQEQDGWLTILGSSNDPNQIEAVAASVARYDLTNVAPSLRSLIEIIATQTFPPHALPSSQEKRAKWYRTKYAEKSDLYESDLEGWGRKERGRRLSSSMRLFLRGRGREAILSGSIVTASPVTRCILNDPLIDDGDAVFLSSTELGQIERWRETGELALLRAKPERRFERVADSATAAYKLDVTNAITHHTTTLRFTEHSPDKNTHYQVEFLCDLFEPTWGTDVNSEWFANLRQGWTDKWFAGLGRYNQIARKNNAILEVKVTPDKFYVIFNRHPDAAPSEGFEWPDAIANYTGSETTKFLSKDLAPILFNLADAPVRGAVAMAGNKHALVFTYETSIGQFEIAVPTLDETSMSRDSALFYAEDKSDEREYDRAA